MNTPHHHFRCGYLVLTLACCSIAGCASQYGHILAKQDKDLVGSHAAGAATWNPLVDNSVAQLLGRCPPAVQPAAFQTALGSADEATVNPMLLTSETSGVLARGPASVCFIGIENKSAEELGDFKDQLYQRIDTQINSAESFRAISRRMVDAALLETRIRPDGLFLPANRAAFAAAGSVAKELLWTTCCTPRSPAAQPIGTTAASATMNSLWKWSTCTRVSF